MAVNIKKEKYGKAERYKFGKLDDVAVMPDLLGIQKASYNEFLTKGIRSVLDEFSPVVDYSGKAKLYFGDIVMGESPKFSLKECKRRNASYSVPMKIKAKFVIEETGEVQEQEVFFGDIPLMSEYGSFIQNGIERVVINQIVRAPSVYMKREGIDNSTLRAEIIPERGMWLEIEQGANEAVKMVIDRSSKVSIGVFLKCFGMSENEIVEAFGQNRYIKLALEREPQKTQDEALLEFAKKSRPSDVPSIESTRNYINMFFFTDNYYNLARIGRYKVNKKLALANRLAGLICAQDIIADGELLVKEGEIFTKESARSVQDAGVNEVFVNINGKKHKMRGNARVRLSSLFPCNEKELGILEEVYYPTLAQILKENKTKEKRAEVIKNSAKELMITTLTMDDILATISCYLDVLEGIATVDKIDHLSHKRLATVGDLFSKAFRTGVQKLTANIKETLQGKELAEITPTNIINPKAVNKALREFITQHQLSQLMEQVNPLSGLSQKRRTSAVGPGGVKKERADVGVRDIHYTHYGRICAIETPEGQNIGLIDTLATYVKVNEYGFLETPYRKVDKTTGKVSKDYEYYMADIENDSFICQANEPLDEEGKFVNKYITCRCGASVQNVPASKVEYMDVSPRQFVSIATSLIPFVNSDETNRALMGANMQRQAVPVLRPEAPIVGTGLEAKVAYDSGYVGIAKNDGVVSYVSGSEVRVMCENGHEDIYTLSKFERTNEETSNNQKPCVKKGDKVKKGEVIIDGYSTQNGELALGKNVLIGYMNWEGYNYEDAILINERLVKEDVYTTIILKEEELACRTTKLGDEVITRDIPNLGEEALKNLDEDGIIRVGAEVRPGDILVGKVTPKGETELTPEERLLRAIFGDKAREVRDTSLRVKHGKGGVVVDVQIFSKKNKDELDPGVLQVVRVTVAQKRKLSVGDKMAGRHGNKGVVSIIMKENDMPFMADGRPLDIVLNPLGIPSRMNIGQVLEVHLGLVAGSLGWKVATPAFDGASADEIKELLIANNFPENGKVQLYDGRTGEAFDNLTTVGMKYMLKLNHMVDSKIHARSTGPYSLITQQPLGGKSLFGGQRFWEMEVWALEAYGASHVLQELLTIKSDDVAGRVKTFEAIIKGQPIAEPGIPESFKVLVKELQALSLDIAILTENNQEISISELSMEEQDHGFNIVEAEHNFDDLSVDLEDLIKADTAQNEEIKEEMNENAQSFTEAEMFDDFGDFEE